MANRSGVGKFLFGWFFGGIFSLVFVAGFLFWAYFNLPVKSVENLINKELVSGEEAKSLTLEKALALAGQVVSGKSEKSIEELTGMFNINLNSILQISENAGQKTYKYKGIDITTVIKGKISEISSNAQTVVNNFTLNDITALTGTVLPEMPLISDPNILNTPLSEIADAIQDKISTYTLRQFAADFRITNLTNQTLLQTILDVPFSSIGTSLSNLYVGDIFVTTYNDLSSYVIEVASVLDSENQLIDASEYNSIFTLQNGVFEFNDLLNEYTINLYAKKVGENKEIVITKQANKLMEVTYLGEQVVVFKNKINLKKITLKSTDLNDGIIKELYGIKVEDLDTEITEGMENFKIKNLIEIDPDNTILNAIVDDNTTLGSLQTKVSGLTVGDIFKDSENSIIISLSSYTLTELETGMSNLKLSDVIEITSSSNAILVALQNTKITEIGAAISSLTVGQVFPAPTGDDTRHIIIQKLAETNVSIFDIGSQFDSVIEDLTLENVLPISTNFNTGVFSLLSVTDSVSGITVTGKYVKIKDFSTALNNAVNDMFTKTLNQLKSLGILTDEDITDSELAIDLVDGSGEGTLTLGDLTIIGIIDNYINLLT